MSAAAARKITLPEPASRTAQTWAALLAPLLRTEFPLLAPVEAALRATQLTDEWLRRLETYYEQAGSVLP